MLTAEAMKDGSAIVTETTTNEHWVLRPGQWELVARLPQDQQREEVILLVESNKVTEDPRSETDNQAMDTARDAASGEAHQEQERA